MKNRTCNICGCPVTTDGLVSLCDKHLAIWFDTDSYLQYKYMKEEESKLSYVELIEVAETSDELWDKWWRRYRDFVLTIKIKENINIPDEEF